METIAKYFQFSLCSKLPLTKKKQLWLRKAVRKLILKISAAHRKNLQEIVYCMRNYDGEGTDMV